MVEFLTPAWFEEVDRLAVSDDDGGRFVVDTRIVGGPDGDVRYQVVLAGGDLRVDREPGGSPPADLTLTLDHATAAALVEGSLDAHRALLAGQVRVTGDLERLGQASPALAAVAAAIAIVRQGGQAEEGGHTGHAAEGGQAGQGGHTSHDGEPRGR